METQLRITGLNSWVRWGPCRNRPDGSDMGAKGGGAGKPVGIDFSRGEIAILQGKSCEPTKLQAWTTAYVAVRKLCKKPECMKIF